jgi:hypothetical protein
LTALRQQGAAVVLPKQKPNAARTAAASSGGTRSTTGGSSYFWHITALYLVFTILLSPLQSWYDIFMGYRIDDATISQAPFSGGNFFFYSIVLNSDSIFRVVQHSIVTRVGPVAARSPVGMFTAAIACLVLLMFSLMDYGISEAAVVTHKALSLPTKDQVGFTIAALIFGYIIHHTLTAHDIKHRT